MRTAQEVTGLERPGATPPCSHLPLAVLLPEEPAKDLNDEVVCQGAEEEKAVLIPARGVFGASGPVARPVGCQ